MDLQDKADLGEIKADVKELVKQGARHNELLRQHEARSLALQEEQKLQAQRFVPLEKQYDIIHYVLTALGTGVLALIGHLILKWCNLI